MKSPSAIAASVLFITSACPAQVENPFVKRANEKPAAETSGESFVGLIEHILVPPDVLDSWLKDHPIKEDAAELRKAATGWIAEGLAVLDQTALTTGIVGLESSNASVGEQIYATENLPPGEGEWPFPTAFENRNIGYSFSAGAEAREGAMAMQANVTFSRMLPHRSWNELVESTRQPTDVFIPNFRIIRVSQAPSIKEPDPQESVDPFAYPAEKPPGYIPDRVHLIARASEFLPEPSGKGSAPDGELDQNPKNRGPERLIFYRGSVGDPAASPQPAITGNYLLSGKIVRVNQEAFSAWLQQTPLNEVPSAAESMVKKWRATGEAEDLVNLTATHLAGSKTTLESIEAYVFPTEWQPGKRQAGIDGKPSIMDFSSGTSFETRNTGSSIESEIHADPNGPVLKFGFERVTLTGESIHHRIQRNDQWVADIKFPIFVSNRWNSSLRVERGKWWLVGSGAALDSKGQFDPIYVDLAFIKVQ